MKIRLTDAQRDRRTIATFLINDAEHLAQNFTPEFWFDHHEHLCLCFEDWLGPVFYVRLDTLKDQGTGEGVVRVYIQFNGLEGMRTSRMLVSGFQIVRTACEKAGAERMIFDSMNGELRNFCIRKFGFQAISGTADLELRLKSGDHATSH